MNNESTNTEEEQTEFDVILKWVGDNKISVIKAMREIKGFGLAEAKDFIESAPKVISNGVSRAEAEKIRQMLEKVGAIVEIR